MRRATALILGWLGLTAGAVWAFTNPPLVEDCNRLENPLSQGGQWRGTFDPDVVGALSSNGTVCSGNAATSWNTMQTADQAIAVKCTDCSITTTVAIELHVRMQQPSSVVNTVDSYVCAFFPFLAEVRLREVVNGAGAVNIATPFPLTINDGDGLGCEIVGNTLSAYHQPGGTGAWNLVGSATDSTLTGPGFAAIRNFTVNLTFDDVRIGSLSVLPTTRLGLHHTAEELAIWNVRRVSGPYADDWTHITSQATAFLADPTAETWLGNQLNVCWSGTAVENGTQAPNALPGRVRGDKLRDAGFVYLLTGDTAYLNQVRTTLLAQAAIAGTNFANATKWCTNYAEVATAGDDFEVANWLRKLVYGYSYIRAALSSADQTTLDTWFRNVGTWWVQYGNNVTATRFPNHATGDYTCPLCPGTLQGITHFGGFNTYSYYHRFGNRDMAHNALVAAIAGTIGDNTFKEAAKKRVKEWLMFNVSADGTVADQERWNDGTIANGFGYAAAVIGSVITTVDHIARMGDTELYTYTTTGGRDGWEGGPKSLELAVRRLAALVMGERGLGAGGVLAYATTSSAELDAAHAIGPGPNVPPDERNQDLWLTPANVFFRDSTVSTAYNRADMPTCAAVGLGLGGYYACSGDWGTYPGIRLMFAQMEGVVSPFAPSLDPMAENCNRTENPLAGGWAGVFDPDFPIAWTANGTVCVSASTNASAYWPQPMGPNMYATATLSDASTTGTNDVSLYLRLKDPSATLQTVDAYRCEYRPAESAVRIREGINGSFTAVLAGPLTQALATGDAIGCQAKDALVSLWYKPSGGTWAKLLEVTDTTLPGQGFFGLSTTTNTVSLDTLEFGTGQLSPQGPVPVEDCFRSVSFDDGVFNIPSLTYGPAAETCEAPTGGDISLTTASAWESTIESATPGARIFLGAGTYTIPTLLLIPDGTVNQGIQIKPNNCAAVTINGHVQPGSYNTLAGLTFSRILGSASAQGAVDFNRAAAFTGVTLRNNRLTSVGAYPLSFQQGLQTDLLVEGNDLQAGTGTFARAEAHIAVSGRNAILRGNRFRTATTAPSNGEDSVELANGWGGDWRIEANWFESNTTGHYLDVQGPSTVGARVVARSNYVNGAGLTAAVACLELAFQTGNLNSYMAVLENNFVTNCASRSVHYAITGGTETGPLDQVTLMVRQNIFHHGTTTPLVLELNRHNASIVQNTVVRGTVDIGIAANPDPSRLYLFQNLFYDTNFTGATGIDQCGWNLFFSATGAPTCANSKIDDPLLINPDSNWHLQSNPPSPARGAGQYGSTLGVYQ